MATRPQRAQTQHTHESNKHHTLHSLLELILPDSLYIQGEGRSFVVTAFRADLFCPRMHSIEPYKQNPEVVFEQPHHRNVLGIVLEDD